MCSFPPIDYLECAHREEERIKEKAKHTQILNHVTFPCFFLLQMLSTTTIIIQIKLSA